MYKLKEFFENIGKVTLAWIVVNFLVVIPLIVVYVIRLTHGMYTAINAITLGFGLLALITIDLLVLLGWNKYNEIN